MEGFLKSEPCLEQRTAEFTGLAEPTADLLTQRMQIHEKTASMLRSMLA